MHENKKKRNRKDESKEDEKKDENVIMMNEAQKDENLDQRNDEDNQVQVAPEVPVILEKAFKIIQPIFSRGGSPMDLVSTFPMVGISILPNSPLLQPSGAWTLVSFLAALPNKSIIFLGDAINMHNVKAFRKGKGPMSDEEALDIAFKQSENYHQSISQAIVTLEKQEKENSGKIVLLRWNDIEGEEMKTQQAIVRKYYNQNKNFMERIGMYYVCFFE